METPMAARDGKGDWIAHVSKHLIWDYAGIGLGAAVGTIEHRPGVYKA